jgi:hypothetical protein
MYCRHIPITSMEWTWLEPVQQFLQGSEQGLTRISGLACLPNQNGGLVPVIVSVGLLSPPAGLALASGQIQSWNVAPEFVFSRDPILLRVERVGI